MNSSADSMGLSQLAAKAHEHGLAHVQLLDAKQVAGLLSISIPTLWRYVKKQCIPQPVRFGPRAVRWRLRDIELFVGEGEVT